MSELINKQLLSISHWRCCWATAEATGKPYAAGATITRRALALAPAPRSWSRCLWNTWPDESAVAEIGPWPHQMVSVGHSATAAPSEPPGTQANHLGSQSRLCDHDPAKLWTQVWGSLLGVNSPRRLSRCCWKKLCAPRWRGTCGRSCLESASCTPPSASFSLYPVTAVNQNQDNSDQWVLLMIDRN